MGAVAELAVAIFAIVLEITIHALGFVYLLFRAIFSPKYRKKLHDEWNTSPRKRFFIVLGIMMYSIALFIATYFWFLVLAPNSAEKNALESQQQENTVKLTSKEVSEVIRAKKEGRFTEAVGELIKQKYNEKKH